MNDIANILFVDDEPQITTSLQMLFRGTDYFIHTANSGAEALDIIKSKNIDVIVSDQRMPNMAGNELLSKVKEISPSTMRILLTGYSDLNAIVDSINDGEIYRFINKPWDNDKLKATVKQAVNIAKDTASLATSTTAKIQQTAKSLGKMSEDGNILVLDSSVEIKNVVDECIDNDKHTVFFANNFDTALDILEKEEIAVIVSDVRIDNKEVTPFIQQMKQHHPLISTIVLTEAEDSESAIDLINRGQVFRYLSKPPHKGLLQSNLGLAFVEYHLKRDRPELRDRNKVEALPASDTTQLSDKILDRIKSLRQGA